jgi:hypothetical protein
MQISKRSNNVVRARNHLQASEQHCSGECKSQSDRTTLFAPVIICRPPDNTVQADAHLQISEQRCSGTCGFANRRTTLSSRMKFSNKSFRNGTMRTLSMPGTPRIKVWLNWVRSAPPELKTRAEIVYKGMNDNPDFSTPPFPLSDLRTETDNLGDAIVKAMDGDKQARAELKHQREIVVNMLRELAHYVEANCRGSEELLRSTGFEPAPTTRKQTPPLSKYLRSIRPGPNRGEAFVTLLDDREAATYELGRAVRGPDGVPGNWLVIPVAQTRPATLLKDLEPGVTYLFRIRAVLSSGYSDWSDPVSYICT